MNLIMSKMKFVIPVLFFGFFLKNSIFTVSLVKVVLAPIMSIAQNANRPIF